LITVHLALFFDIRSQRCIAMVIGSPVNNSISTLAGKFSSSKNRKAPLAAAAAAVPVVKPVFSLRFIKNFKIQSAPL
jgi:hypothetical protein